MRGLYVIHSNENNLIGIVPHAMSTKSALAFDSTALIHPIDGLLFDLTEVQLLLIAMVLISAIPLTFVLYEWYQRNRNKAAKAIDSADE